MRQNDLHRCRRSTPTRSSRAPRLRIPAGERLSFGTYFNAFPASYWRRWTVVTTSTLTVKVRGRGASVTVYKSMANGRSQRVDAASTGSDGPRAPSPSTCSLKPFVDGGWYWYDVVAGDEDVVVESARVDRRRPGGPGPARHRRHRDHDDEPPRLLRQAARPDRRRRGPAPLPRHRARHGAGHQEGRRLARLREAEGRLGATLRVIEQGNLGGSGGYARGQLESVRKGTATYAMMMDDDVVCEPEGIIRAVTFGDLARRPTHRRRPHVQPLLALAAAQLRRDRPALALLVAVAARRASATGTSPPATCARRAGCTSASTWTSTAGSCA